MIYKDRIYGTLEINEPVLLDLIQSAAMKSLHGVLQHGISGEVQPLSTLDSEFASDREDYLYRWSGKWPVRVIK